MFQAVDRYMYMTKVFPGFYGYFYDMNDTLNLQDLQFCFAKEKIYRYFLS